MSHPAMLPTINIGETIRNFRLQRGMSQGDIEKKTGLLRCYLSRVENGHTIPSLGTLSKIALALDVLIPPFFAANSLDAKFNAQKRPDEKLGFLNQIPRSAANREASARKLLLAIVRQ